jgi:hypothetical protein
MSTTELAVRARGLTTHLAREDALAAIEHARDPIALGAALAAARILPPPGLASPDALERALRGRAADDLVVLGRWGRLALLDAFVLDQDRRSVRAILRGIAAGASIERRLEGTVATARLPDRALALLASATSGGELDRALAHARHPLAGAIPAADPIDLCEAELALAQRFAAVARASGRARAIAAYVAQVIDVENATAALLLAARGDDVDRARVFVPGGRVVERATFVAAASSSDPAAPLARAFAGTPIARALSTADPAALDDAALRWQLATQAHLRRVDPQGLAGVLHLLLRRRAEGRRVRRAAWRVAMGGAP